LKTRIEVLGLVLSLTLLIGAVMLYRNVIHRIPSSQNTPIRSPASDLSKPVTDSATERCNHIYSIICMNKGEMADPTGMVRADIEGEKQALKIYHQLIKQHPDWDSDLIDEELVKIIYDPARTDRVRTTFLWVKSALENFIQTQTQLSFEEKQSLQSVLDRVILELPPPSSLYFDEPDLFTKNDVYYERLQDGKIRLRVGGAYLLIAKSWFNLVFTIAHEYAHSIDPCELRNLGLALPAYQKLKSCFFKNGMISAVGLKQECGPRDQFSEVFADWIAVQLVAEALKSYSNVFGKTQMINSTRNAVRDLCYQEVENESLDKDLHPDPEVRIEKIFGLHPQIRHYLGCDMEIPDLTYCNFDSL
jgi:hypothetical protein